MHEPATGPSPKPALDDFDRQVLMAILACECCVDTATIDEIVPDECPRNLDEQGEWVDHTYDQNCSRNSLAVIERVVGQKIRSAVEIPAHSNGDAADVA